MAARLPIGVIGVRAAALVIALVLSGCGTPEGGGDRALRQESGLEPVPSPASPGARAFAPELARVAGAPALTWIETEPGGGATRVRFVRLGDGATEPVTLVTSEGGEGAEPREPVELFANWADRPGVVQGGPRGGESPDGPLFAWWLAKSGDSTYAYEVRVARSDDLGATWRPLGRLHGDPTPAEHGFVSMVPEGEGVRAFWLDGRATVEGRPMTLRTVRIGEEIERETEERLDASVCDCCNTAAVVADGEPVVFYRDRTGGEVRDHRAVRRVEDGGGASWSRPYVLSSDGWEIAACPVNGPAAAVSGDTVWTAWFTAADGRPRVYAARSTDGGRSFSEPLTVDDGSTASGGGSPPLGRLALVAAGPEGDGDAWVSWFGTAPAAADRDGGGAGGNVAVLRARRLSADGPNPVMGPVVEIARTDSSRASGVPRMLYDAGPEGPDGDGGDRLLLAWVEPAGDGERSTVRLARLPAAEVPR